MKHLKIHDVCDRFQVSRSTVYRWIHLGRFPRGLVISGTIRWPINIIERFEAEHSQGGE